MTFWTLVLAVILAEILADFVRGFLRYIGVYGD